MGTLSESPSDIQVENWRQAENTATALPPPWYALSPLKDPERWSAFSVFVCAWVGADNWETF